MGIVYVEVDTSEKKVIILPMSRVLVGHTRKEALEAGANNFRRQLEDIRMRESGKRGEKIGKNWKRG